MPRSEPHVERAAKALRKWYLDPEKTFTGGVRRTLRAAGRGGKVAMPPSVRFEIEDIAMDCETTARMDIVDCAESRTWLAVAARLRHVLKMLDAGPARQAKSRSERSGRSMNR